MNATREIYVSLLNEGIEVWRPVSSAHVRNNVYRIIDQPYDREVEEWQFVPGDEVICELIKSSDGEIFAAVRKA